MSTNLRIGLGSDTHRLVENRKLILGGVEIPHIKGCDGHSDGDALIHAICDALLGASNQRDIGFHFPDNAIENKDKESSYFLKKTMLLITQHGYEFVNADITIHLETPKINPFVEEIKSNLAKIMQVSEDNISIKAKTGEKIGFIGRQEGVKIDCAVLLEKILN